MQYFTETIDMGAGARPLRVYLPDATERSYYRGRRPAVVIFPGGGYAFTYEGEAEPIALRFVAAGACAFVLDYTTTGNASQAFPYAMQEAFAAIRYVRAHAEAFGIDAHNIASLGFSAGGHLCASTGTLWNKPIMQEYLGDQAALSRPDKLILCYPVIRAAMPCHQGSFENLLGKPYQSLSKAELAQFSLQNQVDDLTPPCFLWATAEETCVPVQGMLEFAHALIDHGIHTELHLYPHGDHGSCLGDHVTEARPFTDPMDAAVWMNGAIRFLFDGALTARLPG